MRWKKYIPNERTRWNAKKTETSNLSYREFKATVIKMYGNTTKIKVQINDTGYKVQR